MFRPRYIRKIGGKIKPSILKKIRPGNDAKKQKAERRKKTLITKVL